jgi:NADPH:quinone reductase-like Zn-dependent oxidoreductase
VVAEGQADQAVEARPEGERQLGRFAWWSLVPNRGRRAMFYNFWGGKIIRPRSFRRRLAADLTSVIQLLEAGTITPHIAARLPLTEASQALRLAGARTAHGKVVLLPVTA